MCRDKDHGDRRCPGDTSEARRLRRKSARMGTLSKGNKQSDNKITVKGNLTLEECIQRSQEIKTLLNEGPAKGVSDFNHYLKVEKEITTLGEHLSHLADNMVGETAEDVKARIEDHDETTVTAVYRKLTILEDQASEAWDAFEAYTGTPPVTFGRPSIRGFEELKEADPEHARLIEAYYSLQDQIKEVRGSDLQLALEDHKKYAKEQTNAFLEAQRDAYHQLISSIRPVGGKVNFDVDSDETSEYLNQTVEKYYPTEWLNNSNQDERKVKLISSEERSSYSHQPEVNDTYKGEVETIPNRPYKDTLSLTLERKRKNGPFDEGTLSPEVLEEQSKMIEAFESYKTTLENAGFNIITRSMDGYGGNEVRTLDVIHKNNERIYNADVHGELVNGKPVGEGWERKVTYDPRELQRIIKENPNVTPTDLVNEMNKEHWVQVTTNEEVQKGSSTMTFPSANIVSDTAPDHRASTLLHEMGHRVEHTTPHIMRLEKAFLARRTGKKESNWNDNLGSALGSWNTDEVAHKGDFITPYVGKMYFANEASEVFTVGVEAIYGGGYGGLVGANISDTYHRKDNNHRSFILGVFATV